MNWLVTGGVGFIGFHVATALAERGERVTILDNFCDSLYPVALKERNARDLLTAFGQRIRIMQGDVVDVRAVRQSLESVAGIIHLAGLAGVRPSFLYPARYSRVNLEGTATVFEEGRRAGIRRFLFASSSSIYGNTTELPAREEAAAVEPISPYAATKRSAELIVSALARQDPTIAAYALRFFTVYGPRQRPEMAITSFVRSLLDGVPLKIFGDGSMRRDFTHVDDIVRAIVAAADRSATHPGFRAYNFGSGSPVTLTTLVQALEVATNTSPVLEQHPIPPGDVEATFADIRRASDELGWKPQVSLTDGLATVVRWVQESERAI